MSCAVILLWFSGVTVACYMTPWDHFWASSLKMQPITYNSVSNLSSLRINQQ